MYILLHNPEFEVFWAQHMWAVINNHRFFHIQMTRGRLFTKKKLVFFRGDKALILVPSDC